jgi:DNA polymerase-3 subunit alpha/error-prone DNA polymerase
LFLQADLQDADKAKDDAPRLLPFAWRPSPLEDDWAPANYSVDRRLRDEWAILGFVVGPRMISLLRPRLPASLITSRELPDHVGRRVRLAGLVATGRHTPTVDGRTMQFVTLEDEWGLIEVTLFPGTCPPVAYLTLGPYLVTGIVEEQYGVITVTAQSFQRVE